MPELRLCNVMPSDCMLSPSRSTDVSSTPDNICRHHRPVGVHAHTFQTAPVSPHKKAFTTKLVGSHVKSTTTSTCCEGRCGSPLLKGSTRCDEQTQVVEAITALHHVMVSMWRKGCCGSPRSHSVGRAQMHERVSMQRSLHEKP